MIIGQMEAFANYLNFSRDSAGLSRSISIDMIIINA
jgi:hypothetical protein